MEANMRPDVNEVALHIASDFRKRRIEKGLSRGLVAQRSGVPLGSLARFEQKGLISLSNLIQLAMSMGYLGEITNVFAEPKYSTLAELEQINSNRNKKKAPHEKH